MEPDDRLAAGSCRDGRRWPLRATCCTQRAPARLRGAAVSAGIPLNLVQKWLGHAQLSTTAIYADAVGAEEKDIARRMWG
jgi:integrase